MKYKLINIKEALTFDGLKYFYTQHVKPLKTRISQLGTAANCAVVNNATTTVANTVLDGRFGKTIGDRVTFVENKVDNHVTRTGATAYTGEYRSQWTLTTEYQDIGNSRTFDDKYYSASSGNTKITVKEGGFYLVTASITVKSSGYDNIWMKILKNGAEAHTMVTVANGYTTIQCCTFLTMNAGNWVSVQLSKGSQDIKTTCDGNGYLQIVKLT